MLSAVNSSSTAAAAVAGLRRRRVAGSLYTAAPELAHAATLVVAFSVLLWVSRRQWFFLDEWAMFTHVDASGHTVGVFTPWNEHWSTAVFLYYQLMYHLVGLHSYTPYLAVLIGLHVGIVTCLWRVMVGVGVDKWIAVAAALLFALYGAGWENLIWAFQVGYLAPLLLGLVAIQLVCLSTPSRPRAVLYVVAMTAGLTFSEVGIVMVFCGITAVALRRGPRSAAALNAVPVAVYGAWYLIIGRSTIRVSGSLGAVPVDVVRGLVGSLGAILGSPVVGGALLVGLAWFMLRRRRELRNRLAVPAAMALSAMFFGSLTALARGNMETSLVPRYFYVDLFFLTPTIGLAATSLVQHIAIRRLAVMTVFLAGIAVGFTTLVQASDAYAPLNTETHQYVIAAAVLEGQRPASVLLTPSASIEEHFFPFIRRSTVDRFNHDGVLSYDIGVNVSIEQLVEARLQTAITTSPLFRRPPMKVVATCFTIGRGQSTTTALDQAGSLLLRGQAANSTVSLAVVDESGEGVAPAVVVGIAEGSPRYLNSTLTGAALRITGLAGSVDACPVPT